MNPGGEGEARIDGLSTGSILAHTWHLFRAQPLPFLAAVGGLSALGLLLDFARGPDRSPILDSLAGVFVQYAVTRALVDGRGLVPAGETGGGPATVFGICLLSGFAIVLGLVGLVVPGIFLLARWFAAVPVAVASGAAATSALRESWQMTKGYAGATAGALAIFYAPFVLLVALIVLVDDESVFAGPSPAGVGAAILVQTAMTGAWYGAVAFFELRRPDPARLRHVFS